MRRADMLRRRCVVVAISLVLILEAGAVSPASTVLGASGVILSEAPAQASNELEPAELEPVELVAQRTADSRTFDNRDGTFTTEIYSDAIHYQPIESGDWLPIDVGFEPETADGLKAISDEAPVAVGVRDLGDADGYLKLDTALGTVDIRLLGALGVDGEIVPPVASKAPAVEGAIATYAGVLPQLDLQVTAGAAGAKSFLVLHSLAAPKSFVFAVDAPGMALEQASDGGAQLVDESGAVVGRIPVPYAVDSAKSEELGSGQFSDAVSLTVTKSGGGQAVALAVDPLWLATASFPVYVDPSITFSTTSESFDAFVSQAYPTMNFANYVRPDSPFYHEHWLGKDPTNSTNVNDVFLKFDLSPISDVTVDSATLEVFPYHQYYNAPTATNTWLNVVNGSWSEGGITWNNKPGSTWVTTEGLVEGQTGSFNVKNTVQSWVDGSVANNGVRLHESGENETYWKRLISSEEGGANKPSLVVTYHRPTATPSSAGWKNSRNLAWSFSDPDGGHTQSHRQVQVSTSSTFSSILSDSGVGATASGSWSIPAGVTLTNGTEYYWRVKVKDGKGWSTWAESRFIWDTSAPTGTIAINNGAASTDTSTVGLVLNAIDPSTTASYANNGRSLTSVVGCGSVVCNNAYPAPEFYNNKATGSIVAMANTGASANWHNVTIDASSPNRATIAMDVMRDSTTQTYVGAVSDDDDGLRVELRTAAGNDNLTTLAWTDTSTPQSYKTKAINLAFTPGTWYRLVMAASGTQAGGPWSVWWYPRDTAQPSTPTEIVQVAYVPKPRLHAFLKGSETSPKALFIDNVEVVHNTTGGPYGSGAVAVRFSPDNATWGNWQGYADDLNYALPSGSGTKSVYAQFRDAAGNASSSVNDTISVAFANLGRQPQHRFETWDLGAGDQLAVNVENGNLVLTHPLVALLYRGGNSLALTVTHNSQAADNVGLGTGWQLDVQRRLILNGDNTVTFVAADGARHTFITPVTVGTVTTYTRPPSLYATLVKDTSQGLEFTLTYRDQRRDRFDIAASVARLASIEDRHGNSIALAYDANGNLATATDPASRQVTFTWDTAPTPDRLTSVADWAWIDASGIVQTSATGSRRTYRFFFDGSGNLSGWADPLNTAGSCPTNASHLTCLTYSTGQLSALAKTQTYTTLSGGTLGIATRVITTGISSAGSRVASVSDAESNATSFVADGSDRLAVRRPTATSSYGFQTAADIHGRIASMWRQLDSLTELEQRTSWDAIYPIEPATLTDNFGGLDGAPARTLSFTYIASSMGLLAKVVEPLTATDDRWTEHTYNANNDVTQTIVSLEGSGSSRIVARFCYDVGCTTSGSGLFLLREIQNYVAAGPSDDDTNVSTEYIYDAHGQRLQSIRHNRDASGTALDDRNDQFIFDAKGNLTTQIINYANGQVTSPGDDVTPNTSSLARTDLTTVHTYDTADNLISIADPRRAVEAAVGTSLASDDFVTRWTFDALNQPVTRRTPTTPGSGAQQTSVTVYDELLGIRQETDFGGLLTSSEFNAVGLTLRTFERPVGSGVAAVTSITTYDGDGRSITRKDREQAKAGSANGSSLFTYDAIGRQVSATEASGTATETFKTSAYDGLNQRISYSIGANSDPVSGQMTTYAFDIGGRIVSTDDGFTCTVQTHDYRDLVATTTTGLNGGSCASGVPRTVSHTYDGLGRLTRDAVTAGTGSGDWLADVVFDSFGNRRKEGSKVGIDPAVWTVFAVNRLDQVTVEDRPDGSLAKTTYDAQGNVANRCMWRTAPTPDEPCREANSTSYTDTPDRNSTTSSDAMNQTVELIDGQTNALTSYDPGHNYAVDRVFVPTGGGRAVETDYTYDVRHRLESIVSASCTVSGNSCQAGTKVIKSSTENFYDDNDNRIEVREAVEASTTDRFYCYDARNQLTYSRSGSACSAAINDESFTYDAAGNRVSATSGGTTQNFAYDADGRLCDIETAPTSANCSGGNVGHDADGRIRIWNMWYFTYDADGRLITACKSASCASTADKVAFTYDGEGHRTRIDATSAGGGLTTTEFRYLGDAIVEEKVGGTVVRQFVTNDVGSVVKVIVPTGLPEAGSYLVTWTGHGDAASLLRVEGDGTTTLANSFSYDTWGKPTTTTHNGIGDLDFRYLYVGRDGVQWDNHFGLNLLYMQARHYSPALGRFLQPDPPALEDNLYAYSGNNPVSKTDPQGTWDAYEWTGGWGGGGGGGIRIWSYGGSGGRYVIAPAQSPVWIGKRYPTTARQYLAPYRSGIKMTGTGRGRYYYKYDYTHGEIEVFDRNGRHLGAISASHGGWIKGAVSGRMISW